MKPRIDAEIDAGINAALTSELPAALGNGRTVPGRRGLRLWNATINSINGLRWALGHESAVQEEAVALLICVPLSFFIAKSIAWWLALVGSLLILIVVELLNTAVEKLADHVTPEHSWAIKVVKDLGSAAVLLTLVLAFVVWAAALWVRFA
ncbi:MAG TPA: diacylglycerol kinase [Xanthobacteraceae bacterium]|nr:diacylglycerol kinase [Xanthobacteraceae bacterium]